MENTKTFYVYDGGTKELLDTIEAPLSLSEEGAYTRPFYSTDIAPPTVITSGQFAYFNDTSWELREDTRGLWYDQNGVAQNIYSLAIAITTDWQRDFPDHVIKQNQLDAITVTTSTGKEFNGDETARGDIVTALAIASFSNITTTNWKLADNSTATVTVQELQEALHLALTEKGKIIGVIA